MMGAVTPETCRVALQQINICILLHLVGFLLTLNYEARNYELKKKGEKKLLSSLIVNRQVEKFALYASVIQDLR